MLGNSHARSSHFGVDHYFKDIYKRYTLMTMNGCMIVPWVKLDYKSQKVCIFCLDTQ